MALTYVKYTSDGVTTRYPITFPYFSSEHVVVEVGNEDVIYTVDSVSNDVIFQIAPSEGLLVTIRRVTPRDRPYSDFSRGNRFGEKNVNNSFLWQLYISQEIADGSGSSDSSMFGDLDMQGYRIKNVGKPVDKYDAVRVIDIFGGDPVTTGVTFFSGDTYMRILKPLDLTLSTTTNMSIELKFNNTLYDRVLLANAGGGYLAVSASLKTALIREDANSPIKKIDITELGLPLGQKISLSVVISRPVEGGSCIVAISYKGQISLGSAEVSVYSFDRLFGGVTSDTGANLTAYKVQLLKENKTLQWSFYNLFSDTVPCTDPTYSGIIVGDGFVPADPEEGQDESISVKVDSRNVTFDPTETDYDNSNTNVDAVLREIDKEFYRKTGAILDPDPADPNTPIQPNSVWVADTSRGARARPLPSGDSVPIGTTVLVRDGSGKASTNQITIGNAGQTIMGHYDVLIVDEDWAWVELVYLGDSKWVITSGGVGSRIEPDLTHVMDKIYPVGSVYISTKGTNPNILFGVGVWARTAEGRAVCGGGMATGSDGISSGLSEGAKVGGWEVTLGQHHLPYHQHSSPLIDSKGSAPYGQGAVAFSQVIATGNEHQFAFKAPLTSSLVDATGVVQQGTAPFSLLQPSQAYYIWERVS